MTDLEGGKKSKRRSRRLSSRVRRLRSSLRRLSRKLQRVSRERSIARRRPPIRVLVIPRRSPTRAPQRTAFYRSASSQGLYRSARGPLREGEYQIGSRYYRMS
jgi:hypothetical protein